ncbi:MAG: NAD(P)/FAD-dependent oxidoreductase [Chloroflexi bacterium]|nr:NAD(P)/FAD-dependent oxidoreductase [Chloroflexota bacterium]MBV9595795.1 NAD(P)/FAD-dependent oxidoreductase [Chloroflexota bacterium]
MKVGILGGGALGLAAALRLAQAGQQVNVIEREPRLGGLATGFAVGPTSLEKFYHHIFRTDTTIIGFIRELGLESRLLWGQPNTSTFADGRIVSLGGIPDLLRLPLLPPVDRVRFLAGMAILKAIPDEKGFSGWTAARWMPRLMGRRVYDIMWEPVLRGKFGARADQIAMSWLWSRVHERSLRLGYLRGGFQQLYDALGERIQALGGSITTGVSAERILTHDGNVVVHVDTGQVHDFDRLLVTLPTRLFARLAPALPAEFVQRYPGPEHYGAHVLILGLDRQLIPGVYWLNINDRDLPFLALVEHTNFLPPEDYGGLHLVYLGNYLPMDHPLFGQSETEVLEAFAPSVARIRPGFDRGWVKQHWMFRAPFAQPIVTTRYLDSLPPHRTPLAGVYLANMAHVYPQDRGQNYSLRLGERMAHLILEAPTRRN